MEENQSDVDTSKQAGKPQHSRKRKKQYYNQIRQQMEFYFGDSNLSKDRFLNKLLTENPYVPLDVFMTFNKIKGMANNTEELQKAIDGSEMLKLSTDRQSVRRTTEVKKKPELDEYMIYVEALPPNATHDSVRQLFSQFGNVVYIALPKYQTSGRIKEFAFVEFEEKSSVEKCIQAFQQFDGVIGGYVENSECLASISSYIKEQEELEQLEKTEQKPNEDQDKENKMEDEKECETEPKSDESTENATTLKRPLDATSTSNDDDVPAGKCFKTDETDEDREESADIDFIPATKRKRIVEPEEDVEDKEGDGDEDEDRECEIEQDREKVADGNDNTDEKASDDGGLEPKKKRRRRRNRNPSSAAANKDIAAAVHTIAATDEIKPTDDPNKALSLLRVTTKVQWKRLRNKYLLLQRKKYAEVKRLLRQNCTGESKKVSTLPLSTVRPVTTKNKKFISPTSSKRICTKNINFYGAMRDEQNTNTYECSIIDEKKPNSDKTEEDKKQKTKDLQIEFHPGIIVKVNFDEPCTDVTDFKEEMKQYSIVKYVDLKEGQTYAHVRVDESRSAPVLIKHCAPKRCQILTGESENEYWQKIAMDRKDKLSKRVQVKKSRSNRKLRKIIRNIAEVNVVKTLDNKTTVSHIRFED